ncbi:MAG: four helix bundle protein [Armatimonadota bacterium]
MPMYGQLQVCGQAKRLTVMVYRAVREFPAHERFGISSQLSRAALSVGANIVEGQRRGTTKDFRNFVCMAEGSLAELQYTWVIARELEYVSDDVFRSIWQQSVELEKMLQALRRGLDRRVASAS